MKVTIACKSLLLKKSLELMLKEYISPYNECDFVVSDKKINIKKQLFLISNEKDAHISVPYSKKNLIETMKEHLVIEEISLEDKVFNLCNNFAKDILGLVKNEKA